MFFDHSIWIHALRLPFMSPVAIHRAGLTAMHRGRHEDADALFERAAAGYRREIAVEALARVRAHQCMARLRGGSMDGLAELEQRLARLERIESLHPPFAPVDPETLLAEWHAFVMNDSGMPALVA